MVAEFMLQQTQVARVIEYYRRFMNRFPSTHELAKADLDEVLQLWAGLGYYSRARNLHQAARQIIRDYAGKVPSEVDELQKLPGVGRYTAGAIASIAFETRAPILDGNVARVLLRLFGWEARVRDPKVRAQLWIMAEELLPEKKVGDFNQGLMELGASVCTPKNPDCSNCPLNQFCLAYAHNLAQRIPRPSVRTRIIDLDIATAILRAGDELLFVQRAAEGLWGGLWELPGEPSRNGETPLMLRNRLRQKLPPGCRLATQPVTTVQRLLTHRRVTFHLYIGTLKKDGLVNWNSRLGNHNFRLLSPPQFQKLPLSQACRAILQALENKQV
jgi:A/G-specific adenine glycosylase